MERINKFIELANKTRPSIRQFKDNEEEICRYLNIDITKHYSAKLITDKLSSQIGEALNCDSRDGLSDYFLRELLTEAIYVAGLYEKDLLEIYNLIYCIHMYGGVVRKYGLPSFENVVAWTKAIEAAKNYLLFFPGPFHKSMKDIMNDNPIESKLILSAKFLRDRGCFVIVKDSEIIVESGLDEVIDELLLEIKAYGGIALVETMFKELKQHYYNSSLGRYLITRDIGLSYSLGVKYRKPYGYLLNLAIKYPNDIRKSVTKADVSRLNELYNKIIQLAIHITSVFPTEIDNIWEIQFSSGKSFVNVLQKIALWDSIYSIPQCRSDIVMDMCANMFNRFNQQEIESICGFKIEQFFKVWACLLKYDFYGACIVYKSGLKKALRRSGISELELDNIISVMSKEQNNVNAEFRSPDDYLKQNLTSQPLISVSSTKFILIDPRTNSLSFFEALSQHLRTGLNNNRGEKSRFFDQETGFALEDYVCSLLDKKGIKYARGNYSIGKVIYDADLIVESDNDIVIFEIKKKPLTGEAKSGGSSAIINDLAESVLNAQVQANRIELELIKNKRIDLKHKEFTTTIEYKNRRIEKVTLSFTEYGGFSDKNLLHKFLDMLVNYEFQTQSSDEEVKCRYIRIRKKQGEFINQLNEYDSLIGLPKNGNYFFNSWFISVPQFFHIVEKSSDENSLCEVFKKGKNVTTGAIDFYKEFLISGVRLENNKE